ncbi:hypothetical protein [Dyella flagellata]|uniref:Uncharacterized protein n=1 Tax=Dyella flagellata TaxID=1867833 RepID=A0ABQ5XGT0_9GAMM|nr:hypothetical protein [Dyella flagellata]GLQ90911.1 hypothetical protein GCM10007898_44870 [Dyella flagellata]
MHLELPEKPLKTLGDFLKHYLMIVLSILTALGLEAWIEHAHHTHAAEIGSRQIEAEIRTNLAEVQGSLQQDTEQLQLLDKIRASVVQDLKSHLPDDVVKQHILAQAGDHFDLRMNFPSLRHEAWDVAVANQSASWIEAARMQRYSAAYASQRDALTAMAENTTLLTSGMHLADMVADLQTGEVQPREFLHTVSQMTALQQQAVNGLKTLEKRLDDALAAKPDSV